MGNDESAVRKGKAKQERKWRKEHEKRFREEGEEKITHDIIHYRMAKDMRLHGSFEIVDSPSYHSIGIQTKVPITITRHLSSGEWGLLIDDKWFIQGKESRFRLLIRAHNLKYAWKLQNPDEKFDTYRDIPEQLEKSMVGYVYVDIYHAYEEHMRYPIQCCLISTKFTMTVCAHPKYQRFQTKKTNFNVPGKVNYK